MTIEQLTGRYLRLQQELELAHRRTPWQAAHIDRLTSDLSATEHELDRARETVSPERDVPEGGVPAGAAA